MDCPVSVHPEARPNGENAHPWRPWVEKLEDSKIFATVKDTGTVCGEFGALGAVIVIVPE